MPNCYHCGKKIENGKGVRKEVYTGHSKTAGIFRKNFWLGGRKYYGMRLLCEDCAKSTSTDSMIGLISVVLVIVLLWQFRGCIF
jgi:hypothetical protein